MTLANIKSVYAAAEVTKLPSDKRLNLKGFPNPKKYCLDQAAASSITPKHSKKADCLVISDNASHPETIIAIAEVGGSKHVSEAIKQLQSSISKLLEQTHTVDQSRFSVCALWFGAQAKGSGRRKVKEGFKVNGKTIVPELLSNPSEPIWIRVGNRERRTDF